MTQLILKKATPILRVTLNKTIRRRPPPLLLCGNEIRLAPAVATLRCTLPKKPPLAPKTVILTKTAPTIQSHHPKKSLSHAVIELQHAKPTLKPKTQNPKKHKHAMNKQMRDIVADAADHDDEAARRVSVRHDPGGVGDDGEETEGNGGRIQAIRAINAAYANASRFLVRKMNELIMDLESLKEMKYDNPREEILEGHVRMQWNTEHEIYGEEDAIQRRISQLIVQVMTPNELPSRTTGKWLEESWYTLKFEIANAIITHKPPAEDVIESLCRAPAPLEGGPNKEVAPMNAIDFASRASDILADRIDTLMKCIHDMHKFSASISNHLIIPTFSHHVVFVM
jgi:hypothetical protein